MVNDLPGEAAAWSIVLKFGFVRSTRGGLQRIR